MKNRATKQERQHAYNLLAEPTYPPPPSPNRHTGKTVKVVAIYTYIHTYIHREKPFRFTLTMFLKSLRGKPSREKLQNLDITLYLKMFPIQLSQFN